MQALFQPLEGQELFRYLVFASNKRKRAVCIRERHADLRDGLILHTFPADDTSQRIDV